MTKGKLLFGCALRINPATMGVSTNNAYLKYLRLKEGDHFSVSKSRSEPTKETIAEGDELGRSLLFNTSGRGFIFRHFGFVLL